MRLVELLEAPSDPNRLAGILRRPYSIEGYLDKVKPVVSDVAERCYEAAAEYSERFDGVSYENPLIMPEDAGRYYGAVPERVLRAIRLAVARVAEFHESLRPETTVELGGLTVYWRPVARVGAYVPGGRHPYPSTSIMTVAVAKAAGVGRVYVATPPSKGAFKADPGIVVAAFEAGADAIIALGGPQAVASMAYGCDPVPQVDMVVGPGSGYVQAAKLLVAHRVGIDMVAGPTELAVIADETANPARVAGEMLAQAEHGPESMSLLATPSRRLALKVSSMLEEAAREGLGRLVVVLTQTLEDAAKLVETLAPEHLYIEAARGEEVAEMVWSAGVISLGVPTAYLDYVAGPSHVLPTGGTARWRSGLSVYDFLRPVPVVRSVDRQALEAAKTLAVYEGFELHKASLEVG